MNLKAEHFGILKMELNYYGRNERPPAAGLPEVQAGARLCLVPKNNPFKKTEQSLIILLQQHKHKPHENYFTIGTFNSRDC